MNKSYYIHSIYLSAEYNYTFALTKVDSLIVQLPVPECVNSKGILFTIYRHGTRPVRNYNYVPHKGLQQRPKHLWTRRSFYF
jgi:hypothetical protein